MMPREGEAPAWWAEISDVKERIESRRAAEAAPLPDRHPLARMRAALPADDAASRIAPGRRAMRELGSRRRVDISRTWTPAPESSRRRPKQRPFERIGPRPDRVAAWAVVLSVLMLLAALLSSHG